MANKKISQLPYIGVSKISGNTLVPLVTYFSGTSGDTVHTYVNDLKTFIISGITGNTSVVGNYLPLSGGTVTGSTTFTNGITANTISATTYQNLPVSGLTAGSNINVSGSSGNFTISVTGITGGSTFTGGTVTGPTIFTSGLTATTVSATTYQNLPVSGLTGGSNINVSGSSGNFTISVTGITGGLTGSYLPLSGGTVTGGTIFTSGLTANTLNVTGLTQTKGITSTGGITFKQVTINGSYTATTDDYMIDITGGTFTVSLPTAVGVQGRLIVVKNNGGGAVTVDPFGSETIDGKSFVILGETNSIQLASNGTEWVALGYNISTVNSSTGVFEFTGMTIASPTTFTVAPVKGWIVDDTTNPLSPQLYYVDYSGGTHTATYVTTATETWVYLTSGGTISQSNIELTEQQRRQNIFLGKLGHANKTNIINAFSQPDFALSPLSQLRDMFNPIGFINGGIYASPNGVNLSFNTSAGYLYGLGINFANDTLNPNSLYVSGTAPCTFQYRTQTGGTASNTTSIDPTVYDNGGVVTSIPGSGGRATNQRIYLVQNGIFRVQYGQTFYNSLSAAIEGIATEQFNTFSNFTNNGILIGVLSVRKDATDLSDTSKTRFFFTSKFGETVGAAGGISTTTLQQAYNNSVTPEITTDSTLGALSVKNGAGTLDNVTNVFEGVNAAGTTTSFVRADGAISGTTIFGAGLTASTISATTYQNLPSSTFTGGTVNGSTNFTNGLTANTISATTYQNLPVSALTAGTNISITNTSGNHTISVTGITGGLTFTGGTVSGSTNFTNGLTASTISATTYQNLPVSGITAGSNINISGSSGNYTISVTGITGGLSGDYLPLSGGTVSGDTTITANLTVSGNSGINWFSSNTTSDLVRITQTGNGNAFVVEDSTNPDSTPFIINTSGNTSIGSTSFFTTPGSGSGSKLSLSLGASGYPYSGLPISTAMAIESNQTTAIGLFSSDINNSQIYFGTPGDVFGAFLRWDFTNKNLLLSTASSGGKVVFQTGGLGTEAARIDQNGNFGIGLTSPTQKLEVSGNTRIYGDITSDTISATTYQNLPVSGLTAGSNINVSGSSGNFTITFTGVTGGSTFTGGTVSGSTNFTNGLTANTISATTYSNLPVSALTAGTNISITNTSGNHTISVTGVTGGSTFTGGTISGPTNFTNGLTANTISATTYQNLPVSALTAGANISITNTIGNHTISVTGVTGGSLINPYNNSGSGSTISWDVSGVSTNYEATLTAATTLNLTNVRNGDFGTIIIKQDSVGSRTLTLGSISPSGTHRVANGGGGITLTSNPNAIDILTFTYNGSIMFWTVGNDYV